MWRLSLNGIFDVFVAEIDMKIQGQQTRASSCLRLAGQPRVDKSSPMIGPRHVPLTAATGAGKPLVCLC